jgi:hypothetical protein
MASSVTELVATVPAGTFPPFFATIELTIDSATVDGVRWRVPPGPRGNMGWALAMGGVQVLPDDAGSFIIADDEYDTWQIEGLPDSGAWQLIGYNTGAFDHSVYLSFFTTPITTTGDTGGGDITAGFPTSEADIPTAFLT